MISCDPPIASSMSSDSEEYSYHESDYEHYDVEFAKEQSDISVDTDGDELYEVAEKIESSFDLKNFCCLWRVLVTTASIPHVFASK